MGRLVQGITSELEADAGAIAGEDELRADVYALLATLLRSPADRATLDNLAGLHGDDGELGAAITALAGAAGAASVEAVEDEYHNLFIGIGASELKPYGSYYLTGFVYEKPLADLRAEMTELGIERADGTSEPEDHIASLCEIMCGLIMGAFGAPAELPRQHAFFDRHIAPWAERFFENLEAAESADLYKTIGAIGRLFMRIETQSFEMAA